MMFASYVGPRYGSNLITHKLMLHVLQVSINGVASGMRNTG